MPLAISHEETGLDHPYGLSVALSFAARVSHLRREQQIVQDRTKALLTRAHEQRFQYRFAIGTTLHGWTAVQQGQIEEGITQIRQGLAALLTLGVQLERPYFLALLAEGYGKKGQAKEGMDIMVEALGMLREGESQNYEAELHRLAGQLALQCKMQNVKFPSPMRRSIF